MTFEAAVTEKASISQTEAVLRGKEGNRHLLLLQLVHVGEPAPSVVKLSTGEEKEFVAETGYTRVELPVPETAEERTMEAMLRIGEGPEQKISFVQRPVRPWKIYLVQHTHTDIGYTRPQTEILPEHLRYIDYALDYCDQTDSLPDDARFRWTCETSWAVREYLRSRPAGQVDRLRKRIGEGRIEVCALPLNGSDLADEAALAASLRMVRELREAGLTVRSAMQNDINGIPWCLADYLPGCGVNFLTMAENTHRAHKPFVRPTTFWWESPSGNRILVNRPEHYMWANQLGILTGEETFARNLFNHLSDIRQVGYPFPEYAIQFSGYLTDNSPPSTTACALVEAWNERYVSPKLRLAAVGEFMEIVSAKYGDELETVRGAWPDWWMDGFGSAALETGSVREAHADFITNNGLLTMALLSGKHLPEACRLLSDEILDDLIFYDEHTFGAAESVTDPFSENSVVQWGEKGSYAWEAVKGNQILREQTMGLIQGDLPRYDVPSVTVFNTLSWERSGPVTVYVDHEIIPKDRAFRIVDERGTTLAVQSVSSREDGTYWTIWVPEIPPMGYRSFRILRDSLPRMPLPETSFNGVFSSDFYEVRIDPARGGVVSILDKQNGTELLNPEAEYQAGEVIYERLGANRQQLESLTLEEVTRTTWKNLAAGKVVQGPVWTSVSLTGDLPECTHEGGIRLEIRLFRTEKRIAWHYAMKKKQVVEPEGLYVAFPFGLDQGSFRCEVAGAPMTPGKDQLEGSSSDWLGIQNFIAFRNRMFQVVLTSPVIPLIQPGGLNLGRFARLAEPASGDLFSWVLNNYWTTNFRAYQEGELRWHYTMTSSSEAGDREAAHTGWNDRIPLLARVLPASASPGGAPSRTFMGTSLAGLLLIQASPGREPGSVLLHLREIEGRETTLGLAQLKKETGRSAAWQVNVLGEKTTPAGDSLTLRAGSTLFLVLE